VYTKEKTTRQIAQPLVKPSFRVVCCAIHMPHHGSDQKHIPIISCGPILLIGISYGTTGYFYNILEHMSFLSPCHFFHHIFLVLFLISWISALHMHCYHYHGVYQILSIKIRHGMYNYIEKGQDLPIVTKVIYKCILIIHIGTLWCLLTLVVDG
jgi:hypothetical protein